jgi:hypothetical protein
MKISKTINTTTTSTNGPFSFFIFFVLLLTGWGLTACNPAREQGAAEGGNHPSPASTMIPAPEATNTPEATATPEIPAFDQERALEDVNTQVVMGPRMPGSPGHDEIVTWIQAELRTSGWVVELQETTRMEHPVRNIIARRGEGQPWIVFGAHYDTRMVADRDRDPQKATQPVPGANDGASGVAVLLELARAIPEDLDSQVWLVFFDVEDNGNLPGWDWILGSSAFVESLEGKPDAVVVVDMVGDANLEIYKEKNSTPELTDSVWKKAQELGYSQFQETAKYRLIDDHGPFLQAGIPAIDIIDFDYPYWHTSEDTPDKVSAESLDAVGETLLAWLLEH